MNHPLVSIMIITYNQIDFIHETLTSALEQDYSNLEVVVADDGSTDGTADVIVEYAQQYPDRLVPLVGGPNLGITGNCNRALKACKGKYVAFQGGDDVLLPGKITKQVEWMEEDEQRVLCAHDVEVFESRTGKHLYYWSERMPTPKGGNGAEILLKLFPYHTISMMVRTASIPKHGFDERAGIASDILLAIETLATGGVYGYIPEVYSRYRRWERNITKIMNDHHIEKIWENYLVVVALIEARYAHLLTACRYRRAHIFVNLAKKKFYDSEIKVARQYAISAFRSYLWLSWKFLAIALLTLLPRLPAILSLYRYFYKQQQRQTWRSSANAN